jgi:hypothetical protein
MGMLFENRRMLGAGICGCGWTSAIAEGRCTFKKRFNGEGHLRRAESESIAAEDPKSSFKANLMVADAVIEMGGSGSDRDTHGAMIERG